MTLTSPSEIAQLDVAHTGAATLAGRYLRRFWLPVALLDDVQPGRAKPLRILNEGFTYYRGESGEPHLVGFACAHRSTQMSTGWVEGEDIRCFYHGWRYDGRGQCIEQPAEDDALRGEGPHRGLSGPRVPGFRLRLPRPRRSAGVPVHPGARAAGARRLAHLGAALELLERAREQLRPDPRQLCPPQEPL